MRNILSLLLIGAVTLTSCKKYLDVNQNPNRATVSTPEVVLPQALTHTASNAVIFHDYGSWQAGYFANAGGYGGWGSTITYNYASNDYNTLWNETYDNLQDYQYVIEQTMGKDEYSYYNAAARIMKSYNFMLLVDNYNDVPYKDALKGIGNTTPAYDKAEDVYKAIYAQLDTAVKIIHDAKAPIPFRNTLGKADVLFDSEDMEHWLEFANTLKLKMILRTRAQNLFAPPYNFDPAGFLTVDAAVNPGYIKDGGKQNPFWERYYSTNAGVAAGSGRSRITTKYVLAFYNGAKLDDQGRGYAIYRGFPSPVSNQLGNTAPDVPEAPNGSPVWYSGPSPSFNSDDAGVVGVLKGRTMAAPLLLAAEAYFLVAEANVRGIVPGNAKANFISGIKESFRYLYHDASGNPVSGWDPNGESDLYLTDNATSRLVNFDLATTVEQKIEAIITQKYIANNMIAGHESWAEFRRTGYPVIDNTPPLDPVKTFVSAVTAATTPDKLPGRVIYPSSEYQVNDKNVPTVSVNGSYIFWDRRK